MKFNRKAFVESVTDTILGAAFNFPISWATLAILLVFTTDALFISIIQLTILTIAAIIRRYCTRVYFEKRNNKQTIEEMARKK
jgi:hypothetical protein